MARSIKIRPPPNCLFYFPSSGDNCKSDGAAATGVGFLTAAAAVAAAL